MTASLSIAARRTAGAVVILLLGSQGASSARYTAEVTAPDLLKRSMATYEQMTTFQSDCAWDETYGQSSGMPTTRRKIWYVKPNRFKVVSAHPGGGMTQICVCDGRRELDTVTGVSIPAMRYPAPLSIADAGSMQMGHPMFCGSLLYKFFGGPSRYLELVDESKAKVSFGTPATLDGQKCTTVRFWAQGPVYGKTEIVIGDTDGLVHRIQYGSEPLMEMMRAAMKAAASKRAPKGRKGPKAAPGPADALKDMPTSSLTTETYSNFIIGKQIEPSVFDATPPEGQQVQDVGSGETQKPPVPLGKTAPEILVTAMDGVKRGLSAARGRVIMIDFWATWCPPCREGLKETQRIYARYAKNGLAVFTITDESRATVHAFIKQNGYTFPVYFDPAGVAQKAYNVSAIPTVVVIDRRGNLVAYKVGLTPGGEIVAALKKAGLQAP